MLDIKTVLTALISFSDSQRDCPAHFAVPSGVRHDYDSDSSAAAVQQPKRYLTVSKIVY